MPANFGSFLLGRDGVTAAEIEEATQATVLYGGRLGTALIELGLITPEELDVALSEFLGLPPIPKDWIDRPDPAARAALHVDLVKRHRAFPLLFEKRTLHVGMMDPRNEVALDELAFASGCLIAPHALPEFRYVQLMARVYGVPPSARFRTLLDESHRARLMRERSRAREVRRLERAKELDELAIGPLAADVELTDADAFQVVPQRSELAAAKRAERGAEPAPLPPLATAGAPARPAPAAAPQAITPEPVLEADAPPATGVSLPSLAALEEIVAESPERSAVIDACLTLAGRFAEGAALFVVRDGVAAGLCATRGGAALDIEATMLPLSGDGLLAGCVHERKVASGLPTAPLDKLLAKALRGGGGALAVFPVAIGERVVNAIVAESAGAAFPRTAEAALAALATALGGAYERLIRAQKLKATGKPDAQPEAAARGGASAPSARVAASAPAKSTLGSLPLKKRVVRAPKS